MIIRDRGGQAGRQGRPGQGHRGAEEPEDAGRQRAEVPAAAEGLRRDRADYVDTFTVQQLAQGLYDKLTKSTAAVTDAEIQAQYDKDKATVYKVAASRKVAHILLGPKDGSTPTAKDLPEVQGAGRGRHQAAERGRRLHEARRQVLGRPGQDAEPGRLRRHQDRLRPRLHEGVVRAQDRRVHAGAGQEPVRLPHHQGARRPDEGRHQVAGRGEGADQVAARGSAEEQVRRGLVRRHPEAVREQDRVRDRLQPAADDHRRPPPTGAGRLGATTG